MQTLAELKSYYESGYVFVGTVILVIISVRVWRVLETRSDRFSIFRIKGFVLEKILKLTFFFTLLLGLISVPSLILVASTPSLLVSSVHLYFLLFTALFYFLLELVLCTSISRSLMKSNLRKGVLSACIIVGLFIFTQFFAVSLRTYGYPSVEESIVFDTFPVKINLEEPWLVLEGGSAQHTNFNHLFPQTEYGSSLVLTKRGAFFDGESTSNSDFYSFNKPVFSSTSGRIHTVVDSLPDALPALFLDSSLTHLGNFISVEINRSQYFVVSNLKQGSARVKVGDVVSAGSELGVIGNSAKVGWPQLCFHARNKPTSDSTAIGLPIMFQKLTLKRRLTKSTNKNEYLLRQDLVF